MYLFGGLHLDASRESNKLNPPWFNSRVYYRASLSSVLVGISKPATPHKKLRALG